MKKIGSYLAVSLWIIGASVLYVRWRISEPHYDPKPAGLPPMGQTFGEGPDAAALDLVYVDDITTVSNATSEEFVLEIDVETRDGGIVWTKGAKCTLRDGYQMRVMAMPGYDDLLVAVYDPYGMPVAPRDCPSGSWLRMNRDQYFKLLRRGDRR